MSAILAAGFSGTAAADLNSAFQLLTARAVAARNQFYVYQDADSAFNHGFASGFFGNRPDKLALNPACLDDPQTGCTSDTTRLDRQRGTVAALSFAPLASGEYAGLYWQEPEHYSSTVSGRPQRPGRPAAALQHRAAILDAGFGYDLRGATRVLFSVRSPTGIAVRFGVGPATTQFVALPQSATYLQACIAVNAAAAAVCPAVADLKLDLSGNIDLSLMHLLFMVGTNGVHAPAGGSVLLDDIRYDPVPAAQQSVMSLPLSTQTFGIVPAQQPDPTRLWQFPPDQANRNVASVYEASLSVLALLIFPTADNIANAKAIADALVYALGHDNWGNPLPLGINTGPAFDVAGLHSAYQAGDLALLNTQRPDGGQAGQVRLAGFSAQSGCGSGGYCLVLDGATGGNNAFAMLAILAVYRQTGDPAYLDWAIRIGNWIYQQLADQSGTGFGGYFLGYPDGGQLAGCKDGHCMTRAKSTENNATLYAAYSILAEAFDATGAEGADEWEARATLAGDFVMAMHDPARGCFNAGTVSGGSQPRAGIRRAGTRRSADVINSTDFLDANSVPYLALGLSEQYGDAIDWTQVAACIDRFAATVSVAGTNFSGYGLTLAPSSGANGIAWEFTGQTAVVIRANRGDPAALLAAMRSASAADPFGDGAGLVGATLQDGDTLAPIDQCLGTPYQCIPERVGIAATAWWIFAEMSYNPFRFGHDGRPQRATGGQAPPQPATQQPVTSQPVQVTPGPRDSVSQAPGGGPPTPPVPLGPGTDGE